MIRKMHTNKIYLKSILCAIFVILFSLTVYAKAKPVHSKVKSARSIMKQVFSKPKMIKLKNGARAQVYLPTKFNRKKRYPLLIIMNSKEKSLLASNKTWIPIANNLKMILLCPIGSKKKHYSRKPIDDRKRLVQFLNLLDKKYNIDLSNSVLAGFSKGGTFALEAGLIYPHKFKNVLCIFGYLNKSMWPIIKSNLKTRSYRLSSFYFITNKGSASYKSLRPLHKSFKAKKVKNRFKSFPELTTDSQPALISEIKKIITWLQK
ncbi:alpha/beta hydrolase-fold protein [Candidatus Margulisiibacteriota bacterium]